MLSVGIVVGLCGALGWCGYQLLSPSGSGQVGIVAGAFSPFTLLTMLIDPQMYAKRAFGLDSVHDSDIGTARIIAFVSAMIAIGILRK